MLNVIEKYINKYNVKLTRLLSLTTVFILTSCFANQSRIERYEHIERSLKSGDVESGIAYISDPRAYSGKDELIYYMDNGILHLYNNQAKEAFTYLEKADRLQEELYTESVSENISTYLINDNQRQYQGEDFEIIYLNILKALSFISAEDYEGAMVELRRGINKISVLNIRYQKQIDQLKQFTPQEFGEMAQKVGETAGIYDFYDSVVMRVLSLILHRGEGLSSDSEIDKRRIVDIWSQYPSVYNFKKINLEELNTDLSKNKVLLDVFAFTGLTAEKRSWSLNVITGNDVMAIRSGTPGLEYTNYFPYSGNIGSFNFSVPYVRMRQNRIARAELFVNGSSRGNLDLIEKTSNIAVNQYEKKKAFIIMKTLVRATAKAIASYQLNEEARKKREDGEDDTALVLAGMFSTVFATASEVADIRSWNTLPDNCYFKELELDEGEYKIEIRYFDNKGNYIFSYLKDVYLTLSSKNNIITSYAL